MPRSLLRYRHATPLLVLSLLIGLMSLPDVTNHLLGLMRPTASAATSFTVNSTGDGADSNLADGVCNDGTGACTLRAAIQQANALVGDDTINFSLPANSIITLNTVLDAINDNLIINGPGANTLTVQRSTAGGTPSFRIFTINSGKTVTMSGLTISNGDANGFSNSGFGGGLFNNGTLTLSGCNFYGNSSLSVGGGIYNTGPSLILNNCNVGGTLPGQPNTSGSNGAVSGLYHNNGTLLMSGGSIVGNSGGSGIGIGGVATLNGVVITNNIETKGVGGGGITVFNSASANIVNCLIANNSSGSAGGGVYNSVGTVNLVNSTISGNTAFNRGAGIENFNANMTLTNVTVTNNRADTGDLGFRGGGLEEAGGIITLRNTLISGNFRGSSGTTADDISGTVSAASSFNLIGTGGAGGLSNTNGNQIGVVNALLAPLGNYGGLTQTHALLPGSPAIDSGSNANLPLDTFDLDGDGNTSEPIPFDQRGMGFNRAADGNGDGTTTVDLGAYEFQGLLVTNTNDSGAGSLRQAIIDANANSDSSSINFQLGLTGTISLSTALPDLSTSMAINGPGASVLTVQRSTAGGTPNFRIFKVNSGITVNIAGLTISNGNLITFADNGGGVLNSGALTLTNCNIHGNSAGLGLGGGIYHAGSSLNLNNCNIGGLQPGQANRAGASGGGVFSSSPFAMNAGSIVGNSGIGLAVGTGTTAKLNGVVITNNTESGSGGAGVLVSGTANITNSLIANNTASGGDGGGIRNNGNGTLTVTNSTISGNSTIGAGGGVYNFNASATLINVTVTNNLSDSDNNSSSAENGGGVHPAGGTLVLTNSIVAGNFYGSAVNPIPNDLSSGASSSSSFNLIGVCDGFGRDTGCDLTNGVNNNQVGVSNARLGPLANNGGPTLTHALLAGSPALDAGNNCVFDNSCSPALEFALTTDQRGAGFSRKADSADAGITQTVDIGAFEAQASVEDIADKSTAEDTPISFGFNVGDAAAITNVTASSANATLVPNLPANLIVTGSGSTRTLNITPVANQFGTSTITVTVTSGSESMSDTFMLTVTPVADMVSATDATTTVNTQTAAGLVITRNAVDGAEVTHFKITNITNGTLFKNDGTTQITNNSFITFAEGNAGLKFTPANNLASPSSVFSFQVQGATSSGGAGLGPAATATITVNCGPTVVINTNDSGAGSLRSVINAACPGATITFNIPTSDPGFVDGVYNITLTSAELVISKNLTITGLGANALTIRRSTAGSTPQFRIFNIQNSTITLTGLTVSGGFDNGGGAGVLANSGSTLNINGCVISGNTDNNFRGGGISSAGTLSLANSTVSGNTGSGIFTENGIIAITNTTLNNNVGSAIRHLSPFPFSISNSTISGNSGGLGGGIFMSGGVLTMSNTTVSGNTSLEGGGFFTGGGTTGDTLLLNNCTITGNRGTAGGFFTAGGIQTSGSLTLKNSIVAGNFKDSGTTPGDVSLVGGSIQSASSNLIGDANSSGGITHGVNGNQVGNGGSGTINIHTVLAVALANNGGPTLTHALLAGSPALDAGDNCVFDNTCAPPYGSSLITDQRGPSFSRKVDGPDADITDTVDIGAFEAQVSVEAIANQTINEDSSLSLSFNLGGAASITSVTATSSDSNLVPNNPANISISGSGSSRTLLITPIANAFGTSNITVTVNGSNSQTMTHTFLLTVNSVNDAPSFIKGLDQTVNENDGAQTVNNWATNISAGPANEAGQTLTFIVANNSNPALFAVAPAISSSGTLMYTPAIGVSGVATITIALMDNGGTTNAGTDTSATQSFNINVLEGGTLAFNSATYSVNENAGPATVTITRTGGGAGTATVLFTTSNGTATSADYTAVSQTVTFNDGDTSKTVNIPIADDSVNEPDETINLTLSNVGGSGELGTPATAVLTILNDDTPSFQFEQPSYTVSETSGSLSIVVKRAGDTSNAATVDYATNDFTGVPATDLQPAHCEAASTIASSKCDYATSGGRLRFAAGETSKIVVLSIVDDIYVEGDETLSMSLSNPSTGNLVSPSTAVITIQSNDTNQNATGSDNPYLGNAFFVRQHYLDFLLREPDTDGFNSWLNVLNNCQPNRGFLGSDPGCDRVHVSSGFFRSTEFGERGYWVYRFFSASLGRRPLYAEFTPEMRRLSGLKPQADLDKDETDFINEFMQRPEFTTIYNGITDAGHASAFIGKLEEKAGVTLPATVPPTQPGQPPQYNRQDLIDRMQNGTLTTAQTLTAFVEQKTVWDAYFFKAFVAMEYFGYLRRDPENAGYDDWVDVLTNGRGTHPPGDYRHLVFGFIYSEEYRERFGPK
jgi:CSLREA domain-containing protein